MPTGLAVSVPSTTSKSVTSPFSVTTKEKVTDSVSPALSGGAARGQFGLTPVSRCGRPVPPSSPYTVDSPGPRSGRGRGDGLGVAALAITAAAGEGRETTGPADAVASTAGGEAGRGGGRDGPGAVRGGRVD